MGSGIVSLFCKSDNVESIVWWGREKGSAETKLINVKKEISRYVRQNSLDKELIQCWLKNKFSL